MPPPPIVLNAQAVSGITGSISIACWIIVFAPQIYENFTRKSSEGLSLMFIILWLAGDLFNVLGSILQGVLPTMIILAIYYTFADIVLLWQCLNYNHKSQADLIHLSPASPFDGDTIEHVLSRDNEDEEDTDKPPSSPVKNFLFKLLLVTLVFGSGLVGWYISYVKNYYKYKHPEEPKLVFDPLAQFFGWLCAFLYLGSRVPQILLNFKRKSCEGISFMFFLFACL
ncbi:PQ-loop-domain-containing protein, partial [Yamadazyma tenuis ATCC 10573]